MTTSTIVWIVVAVAVALLLIAVIVVLAGRRRRQGQADHIREHVREEIAQVERRDAIGAETAAKARAAKAEADVKAAEAARLQQHAAAHQSEAAAARDQVNAKLEEADRLDPRTRKSDDSGRHEQPHRDSDGSQMGQVSEAPTTRAADRHEPG
jgi:hypothetical protein